MILEQELKWICEYLKIKNTKKNICEDYLDKKYIDSIGFLKFILAIEKKFKIKFTMHEMTYIKTYNDILKAILMKKK
jgi:acyl carrier protein